MDEGRTDSREREISVHALRYCQIQYITTPKCRRNKDTLASTFYPAAAEDRGGGKVFFRYFKDAHPKNAGKCSFPLNEPLCLLLGCGRTRSVMAFADCRDVEVADVDVRSGVAMGIVAEMCENIRIVRYNVRPDEGSHVSLTTGLSAIRSARRSAGTTTRVPWLAGTSSLRGSRCTEAVRRT